MSQRVKIPLYQNKIFAGNMTGCQFFKSNILEKVIFMKPKLHSVIITIKWTDNRM